MRRALVLAALAVPAAGCAHPPRPSVSVEQEFAEVAANCRLPRVVMRPATDAPRTLLIHFPQRSNMYGAARRDGSLGCVEHWAHEHGYKLRFVAEHELPY